MFWGDSPLQYDLDAVLQGQHPLGPGPHEVRSRARPTARSSSGCPACCGRCSVPGGFPSGCGGRPATISRTKSCRRTSTTSAGSAARTSRSLETPQVFAELRARCVRVLDEFGKESLKPGFFGALAFTDLRACWRNCWATPRAAGSPGAHHGPGGRQHGRPEPVALPGRARRGGHGGLSGNLRPPHGRRNGTGRAPLPRRPPAARLHLGGHAPQRPIAGANPSGTRRQRAEVEKELPALLASWGGSSFREQITARIRQTQRLLAYRESGNTT